MTFHVAFLQPRNTQPSWPADPPPAVPAPTGGGTGGPAGTTAPGTLPGTPVGVPTAPTTTQTTSVTVTTTTGGDLSQDLCESASRSMLISAGGYVFAATLLGVAVFLVMRKKLWSTVFGRYFTAILLAALTATVLMAVDPARADDLTRCLNNPEFSRYVILGSGQAARALVLGMVPAFVLTTVGCLIANRT